MLYCLFALALYVHPTVSQILGCEEAGSFLE
jgi:hypothetical protein